MIPAMEDACAVRPKGEGTMLRAKKSGLWFVVVLAMSLGLAGCSGGAGPLPADDKKPEASQGATSSSPEESNEGSDAAPAGGELSAACLDISESMATLGEDLSNALENGLTDSESVKEAIRLQAEALQAAAGAASHPEVKVALQDVADDMGAFSAIFQDLPDLSDPEALANNPEALEKMGTLAADMQTVSADLNASMSTLLTLCKVTP